MGSTVHDDYYRENITAMGSGKWAANKTFKKVSTRGVAPLSTCTTKSYEKHFKATCLEEAKEERVLEKEAPKDTGRSCVTTSRASPSLPFAVWPAVVASRESPVLSTRKLVVF